MYLTVNTDHGPAPEKTYAISASDGVKCKDKSCRYAERKDNSQVTSGRFTMALLVSGSSGKIFP